MYGMERNSCVETFGNKKENIPMSDNDLRMVCLRECKGVASFTGHTIEDGIPHVAVTVANIHIPEEVMFASAYAGQGVYGLDADFQEAVFKRVARFVRSSGADAEDMGVRVLTSRFDCTRTLWVVVPVTVIGVRLLENIGECVELALGDMARGHDDEL
jgi:hypothetical protein